ncbi:MAG: SDR family NAD(P)-dependent oxidoreductase [Gammaproteobacteria bacterium]|nr:SDR family oxidoreductase [Pseudomonadota bacterium]MDG2302374.1 SDR family NAD(P)-dependent oxidoreductase [Gammaproteobacteria bacterium]MBT5065578.1 SDR family oxidoreductase [Pseudomonadota bacterium]MBT6193108.1 SDR family oxidoreductase [Pseudomonadota bacterium]MBT6465260.1 SDR family oxidoreductase [Pseudomonadota bacterium]
MRLSKLSRSIEKKVAVITGAASGMGRATAHLFADEGAHVVVTDLDKNKIDIVVTEILDSGGSASGWVLDVSDAEQRASVVKSVADKWGGIDILINNAGVVFPEAIDSPNFFESWHKSVEILLTSQVMLVKECLPYLEASDGGRIVNIASTEALGATKGVAAYTAAKTGVIGLTRSLAVEFGMRGITVNCICPGPINTGMTSDIPDDAKQVFANRRSALKRYAEPEEVAHGTLNFVLPASQYITGTHLAVDGGLTIKNA